MSRARIVHNNKSSRHSVFFLFCGESVDFSFISRFDVAGEQLTQSFRTLGWIRNGGGGSHRAQKRDDAPTRDVRPCSSSADTRKWISSSLHCTFKLFFFSPACWCQGFKTLSLFFLFLFYVRVVFSSWCHCFMLKRASLIFFFVVFLLICDGCQCHTRSHEVTQRRYGRRVERKKTASVALNCFLLSSSSSLSGNYTVVDCQITAGLMC